MTLLPIPKGDILTEEPSSYYYLGLDLKQSFWGVQFNYRLSKLRKCYVQGWSEEEEEKTTTKKPKTQKEKDEEEEEDDKVWSGLVNFLRKLYVWGDAMSSKFCDHKP